MEKHVNNSLTSMTYKSFGWTSLCYGISLPSNRVFFQDKASSHIFLKTIKHKNSLWLSEIQDPCHQPQPNCNDFWIMILDEGFLREKRVGVALPSIEPNLAQICSRLWQLGSDFLQIGGSFFFCFISTRAHNKIVTLWICFKYLRKGLLYIMINQSS